ncbi:CAP domain-containing protein [Sphingomonas citricola]|uniref:CAP domain-containing protein n=1 Tax=Sphingomonas citricola TaxID=2862498 RepID=UPI0027E45A46|nr:CAP domain-containing protein [Sphingomonas citricola]
MTPKRHAALLALSLGACSAGSGAPAAERVVEPMTRSAPAARGAGLLRQVMISRHNAARAALGVAPLQWDDALVADARRYAEQMALSGRFAHAEQHGEGENLFTGTRGAYSYAEMVDLWLAERRDFVNAATPGFSRTGRAGDVAHYTQIVWRRTRGVGCAIASNARDDFLVCRYSPPGNVVGERSY